MHKKNLINLFTILLLTTCYWSYTNYVLSSTNSLYIAPTSKIDFINFPTKNNVYKIYPSKKELLSQYPHNITTISNLLKIGSRGNSVKYIQNRLVDYGYNIVTDGLYTAPTYDAILNFQYRCRLDFDGEVGMRTLEKLNMPPVDNIEFNTKSVSLTSSKNTTSNIPLHNYKSITELTSSINSSKVYSATNYHIDVDLPNQRVNIFIKYSDKWVLDKSFLCSSGTSSTPTITGNFTISDKGPMFRAGSNIICNYYTRISGNYLFHTVLLDNNKNIVDGRLGNPLSHGCIRLAIDDAKYIYTSIPYGTSISIN